mmetsp:Transcript_134546/g.418126  ORF Transcript_134546/g.418126 Transcript_134546/m.418126 type:complete len:256 (-) Transcript_134546:79-846(-)
MPSAASLLTFDAGHEPLTASDVAAAAALLCRPGGAGRGRLAAATAFFSEGASDLAGLGAEGQTTTLEQAHPPKRGVLDELSSNCKLNLGTGGVPGGDQKVNAKDQGNDVAKSALCAQHGGEDVLEGYFGKALEPKAGKEATGVELKGSTELQIGSLARKQLTTVQDSCHDFASVLLHRLGRPAGSEDKKQVEHMLDADDAAHLLRSYGKCLMEAGEAGVTAGCRLGNVDRGEGEDEISLACKEAMGPPEKECHMM